MWRIMYNRYAVISLLISCGEGIETGKSKNISELNWLIHQRHHDYFTPKSRDFVSCAAHQTLTNLKY